MIRAILCVALALAMGWRAWAQDASEWLRRDAPNLVQRVQREKEWRTKELAGAETQAENAPPGQKQALTAHVANLKALLEASDRFCAAVKAEKWAEAANAQEDVRALRRKVENGGRNLEIARRIQRAKDTLAQAKDDPAAQAKAQEIVGMWEKRLELQKQVNDVDDQIAAAEAFLEKTRQERRKTVETERKAGKDRPEDAKRHDKAAPADKGAQKKDNIEVIE